MKKIKSILAFSMLMVLLMVFSGCSNNSDAESNEEIVLSSLLSSTNLEDFTMIKKTISPIQNDKFYASRKGFRYTTELKYANYNFKMTKDVIMSVENEYTNSKDYFAIYICETPIKTSLASCSGYREDSFSMSFESSVNESLNNEFSYSASTSAEFFGTKITGSVRNSFGTSLSAGRVESIDITFIPSENTQQKIGAVLQGETYYCIVQSVYSYNSGNRIVSECCYSLFTFNDVVKHIQIMK